MVIRIAGTFQRIAVLSKRNYIIVISITVAVRVVFMLWSWSGWRYQRPLSASLSYGYFCQGYGIAAGYGYNDYHSIAAQEHIGELWERVTRDSVRALPGPVGPLPQDGVYPCAVHPPGFPLLVAGINRSLGIAADVPIQMIGIALDTMAAVIVVWLVSAFLSARVGFVTGILYGVFPPLAYQSACAKMPGSLLAVFIVSALACVLVGSGRSWGWGHYVAAGLLLGIASYLRPDFVLLPMFLMVCLWIYTRRLLRSVGAMMLTQMVILLVLFPWALRNHRVFDRWMFTTTGPGPVLVVGLGQFKNPWGFVQTDGHLHQLAREEGLDYAWAPAADDYFKRLFWQSVREDPGAWIRIVGQRVPLAVATPFYWGFDNPNRELSFMRSHKDGKDRYQIALERPMQIIAAYWDRIIMAVVSLACSVSVVVLLVKERRRWGLVLMLLSPGLFAIISHVMVVWGSRYVVPSAYGGLMALAYAITRGWRESGVDPATGREMREHK